MNEPKRYIPALNGTAFMGMAESNGIGNTYGPRYCMEDYSSGFVRSADYDALKDENERVRALLRQGLDLLWIDWDRADGTETEQKATKWESDVKTLLRP